MELIQCTRQPGHLRITKEACAHQYSRAQKYLSKKSKNAFYLGRYKSLEVCKRCPKGRRHFEELNEGQRRSTSDHTPRRIRLLKTTKNANV